MKRRRAIPYPPPDAEQKIPYLEAKGGGLRSAALSLSCTAGEQEENGSGEFEEEGIIKLTFPKGVL